MRKLFYLLLIFTINNISAQEVNIGTIFTIEFNDLSENTDFEIVSREDYKKIIELSQIDSIIKPNPENNQIIGIFAKGKFGNNTNTMLLLISGISENLDYNLEIKLKNKRSFKSTSTTTIFKNVKSIEYWPYQIDKIRFNEFEILDQPKIIESPLGIIKDSTCIKNPVTNFEISKNQFQDHIKNVIKNFNSSDKFVLESMLPYEDSLKSENVSRGYKWSLSEGIYPYINENKLGAPLTFRKVECPFFDNKTNYFYTEKEQELKVVSFNWQVFKESHFGSKNEIKNELNDKFDERFNYVLNTVNNFLGKPIQNFREESGQRKIRWKNDKGTEAYLFNFSNSNEIRLYIYQE